MILLPALSLLASLALLSVIAPSARAAEPPSLALPLDCTPGVDCWVVRYLDHDPGPGVRDYACGGLSGDGHNGTDIAIRDLAVMAAGVEVRAAAAGVVAAVRDGMVDVSAEDTGRRPDDAKACGNGIEVDHGGGWTTRYCHLRRGSLRVAEGDRVVAGQSLALVGLSGNTNYPHLELDVRRDGEPVDPFTGLDRADACAPGEDPLWQPEVADLLAYQPVLLTSIGFATAAPMREDVRRGWHQEGVLPKTSPALVLWVDAYWVAAGDRLGLRIVTPDGATLVDETVTLEKASRRWFQFAGKRRPADGWPPGSYRGEVTLERDGLDQPIVMTRTVELR